MPKTDKIFSQEDFDKAGRIDRLYMTMLEPDDFVLTDTDSSYLDILTRAYPIICTGRPSAEVILQIGELEHKWQSQAIKIYKDAQELFGRFEEINPLVMRGIFIAKMQEIANKMQDIVDDDELDEHARAKAGDVMRKCWADIAKVSRLDKIEAKKAQMPLPPRPLVTVHEMYKDAEIAMIDNEGATDS